MTQYFLYKTRMDYLQNYLIYLDKNGSKKFSAPRGHKGPLNQGRGFKRTPGAWYYSLCVIISPAGIRKRLDL